MNQLLRGSEEIQWWLTRAISFVKPYIGEVTRYLQIDQPNQLAYYAPGKVFQWVNFCTATTGTQPTADEKTKNVVFHIIGQTCRPMSSLSRYDSQSKDAQDVLFGMGTEFLCCMTQYRGNQTHIYLREIRTGFGSNTVLWVDDELFPPPGHGLNENQKLLFFIYHQSFQKNVNFVLKASSKLAWSYINSEFFKIALEVC